MKILPKHDALRTIMYLYFGIGIILALFLPNAVVFCFKAHAFFLFLAILCMVMPWANKRMAFMAASAPAAQPKRRSFISCVGITFVLQIALLCAFYTLCHVTAITLPINLLPFPLFQVTMPILWWNWGIFPWGIYVLVAAALAGTIHLKKEPGDMSTLIRPVLRNTIGDDVSLSADVNTKTLIAFSLSFTLACVGLECMGLVRAALPASTPFLYGMRLDIFLAMVLILQSTKSDFFAHQTKRLLKRCASFWGTAIFLVVATIGMGLISVFIGWFSPAFTPPLNRAIDFFPLDWFTVWFLFSGMWWMTWTPLVAGMMVHVWQGYKIHTMMLWMLFLPVVIAIYGSALLDWIKNIASEVSVWNSLPACFSAMCILLFFLRAPMTTYVWKASLKGGELQHYQRNPNTFLQMVLATIVMVMALYWTMGMYVLSILSFCMLFMGMFFICAAAMCVLSLFCKKLEG